MFCNQCGKPIEENCLFCPNCGAKVSQEQPKSTTEPEQTAVSETAAESHSTAEQEAGTVSEPIAEPPAKPKVKGWRKWFTTESIIKQRILKAVLLAILLPIAAIIGQMIRSDEINNPDALQILQTSYPNTNISIEDAFENYFEKPKWEFVGPDENGNIVVEFTGRCTYDGIKQKALLQFSIDKETEDVWCNWLELDGESQAPLIDDFLFSVFEPYFLSETIEKNTDPESSDDEAASPQLLDAETAITAVEEMYGCYGFLQEEDENGYYIECFQNSSFNSVENRMEYRNPLGTVYVDKTTGEITPATVYEHGGYSALDLMTYDFQTIVSIYGSNFERLEDTTEFIFTYPTVPYIFFFAYDGESLPLSTDMPTSIVVHPEGLITDWIPANLTNYEFQELDNSYTMMINDIAGVMFLEDPDAQFGAPIFEVNFVWDAGLDQPATYVEVGWNYV